MHRNDDNSQLMQEIIYLNNRIECGWCFYTTITQSFDAIIKFWETKDDNIVVSYQNYAVFNGKREMCIPFGLNLKFIQNLIGERKPRFRKIICLEFSLFVKPSRLNKFFKKSMQKLHPQILFILIWAILINIIWKAAKPNIDDK